MPRPMIGNDEKAKAFLDFVVRTRGASVLAFGKETPVHEASCILDVLTMMYHQVPNTSQLGALLDFRDM